MKPRWAKVFSDLTHNKVRSGLVIASIMVGLFAVGMVLTIYQVLRQDIRASYREIYPANIQIQSELFTSDLVKRIKDLPEVADAYGAWTGNMRLINGRNHLVAVSIKAIEDAEDLKMDRLTVVAGKFPPGEREIVLEKNLFYSAYLKLGDEVVIKVPSGKERIFRIVGIVQDQTLGSASGGGGFFISPIQGYINYDSLEWMDLRPGFNHLYVRIAGDGDDLQQIRLVTDRVVKVFDYNSIVTHSSAMLRNYEHPNLTYLDAVGAVLVVLGFLVVFLSASLITNTLSALLKQQMVQIGVMKSVGATQRQIISIYIVLILAYSAIALAIAIPAGYLVGYWLLEYLAVKLNFVLQPHHFVPEVVVLQSLIALIVPLAAGFPPIHRGIKVPIVEALSGVDKDSGFDRSPIAGMMGRVRGLSRPTSIALRNTFRKKGRLALTLLTLTLGGAIFIGTFNVRVAIEDYIATLRNYFIADINLTFNQPYRLEKVKQDLLQLPDVSDVEGWGVARVEMVREDGTAGDAVSLLAPPGGTPLLNPMIIEGRWLDPRDQKAIVLSELFFEKYPALKVGDKVRMKVNGVNTDWTIVGFFQFSGKSAGLFAYTEFTDLARMTNSLGRTNTYRIVSTSNNLNFNQQMELGLRVEDMLKARNYHVADVRMGLELQEQTSRGLNILTSFMLILATLMAMVGSIGLMGTMSLNVMERVKEIGIMRAIGAADGAIMRMVLLEGLVIGLLSWAFGVLAAIPVSKVLADIFGRELFGTVPAFAYTWTGPVIWLGLVTFLAVIASVMPARNAAKLTIREVLSYE